MYVIDASVWISRFVRTDLNHVRSREWLASVLDLGPIVMGPALVLPEVGGAVSRRTGRIEAAKEAMAELESLSGLEIVPLDSEAASVAGLIAAETRLRGGDAVYLSLAADMDWPLVTWDRELRDRGRSAAQVYSPDELAAGSDP
jgi:predicted nucleic acid-binding protein